MAALFSTDHTTLVVTVQEPGGELRVTTNAGGPDPIIIPPWGGGARWWRGRPAT
jgi:hypothetical protein